MKVRNPLSVAAFIVVLTTLVSMPMYSVGDYLLARLHLNSSILSWLSTFIIFLTGMILGRNSDKWAMAAIFLILLNAILVTSVHYYIGSTGVPLDFSGVAGAKWVFKIQLVLGALLIGLGCLLGLLIRRIVDNQKG